MPSAWPGRGSNPWPPDQMGKTWLGFPCTKQLTVFCAHRPGHLHSHFRIRAYLYDKLCSFPSLEPPPPLTSRENIPRNSGICIVLVTIGFYRFFTYWAILRILFWCTWFWYNTLFFVCVLYDSEINTNKQKAPHFPDFLRKSFRDKFPTKRTPFRTRKWEQTCGPFEWIGGGGASAHTHAHAHTLACGHTRTDRLIKTHKHVKAFEQENIQNLKNNLNVNILIKSWGGKYRVHTLIASNSQHSSSFWWRWSHFLKLSSASRSSSSAQLLECRVRQCLKSDMLWQKSTSGTLRSSSLKSSVHVDRADVVQLVVPWFVEDPAPVPPQPHHGNLKPLCCGASQQKRN